MERVKNPELRKKVTSGVQAAQLIQNGMTLAMGGYTSSGYPKLIARELVKRKEAGEDLNLFLITGANVGPLDKLLGDAGIISRRTPMLADKNLAKKVNSGQVTYVEQQMHKMPQLLKSGAFGDIDVAVVEALEITEEGHIIPTSSIGMVPHLLDRAKKVIVEVNEAQPQALKGLHDVYMPAANPYGKPIPLSYVNQKIGKPYIKLDPQKIEHIVISEELDELATKKETTITNKQIVNKLVNFLQSELRENYKGRPFVFQTGFGNMADAITEGFKKLDLGNIQFFCGIVGESIVDLIAEGRVRAASCGSLEITPRVSSLLNDKHDLFKKRLVIRNGDISNNGGLVNSLGVISLNSGIEIDIYGNVNASHISGYRVVNGLGGGASFAHNASLSIILLPSISKGGAISNIVPMTFHQDIIEHDVDVLITENGVADLRGKSEVERAKDIIENCADETYKEALNSYLSMAIRECGGHRPQLPVEAFSWYKRLKESGSMI